MTSRLYCLCFVLLVVAPVWAEEVLEEPLGKRPYEMVWADRNEDAHPALVDFENLAGWTVAGSDAEATLVRCREQQLWGNYVGRLTYRGQGAQATVTLRPPQPIRVSQPFNAINFWVYGNNWEWVPDPSTPPVDIVLLFRNSRGESVRIGLGRVRWQEWWVMHSLLSAAQQAQLQGEVVFEGIEVRGGHNRENRQIYFDNLSLYQEALPPLVFEPRPARNLTPWPGQTTGTNTGPGRLPFPTREETILPTNLCDDYQTTLEEADGTFTFRYAGPDGQLLYTYRPTTGTLSDVTAEWLGRGGRFQPLAEGGLNFAATADAQPVPPDKLAPLRCQRQGDTVESVWQATIGSQTAELTYTLRLWQKSLVVDVRCTGGLVADVHFGRVVGLEQPRLVTLPYLVGDDSRPAVVVAGKPESPLFLLGLCDHYRSNASQLWMINRVADDGVTFNGGARYLPKTDGRRNDCFERLFLTVSPRFEEVLPNIANPPSPWMAVAGERVWIAYGATNRETDYAFWKNIARYGMTKVLITDHETGWRDGGESFTFRTRAAPGKGGDEAQADYARKIHALGFRYGIYNNYTDYAPVNGNWDEDCVTRTSPGNWLPTWPRCYNPKPARAVEFEARLAPIIQEKFQLDTAYCDVHTAVRPWQYVDFDARVPGAGTFAATFYAYGEIMLHQKRTWNGPVYSEGNNHWYYCGLTDGNYAQDQAAHLPTSPWLVDFDLRKMHPLGCNFGMGYPSMFYGPESLGSTPELREVRLDRFLAATLAFGHTGFLVLDSNMANTVRSYFSLQQVQQYAQATVVEIQYLMPRAGCSIRARRWPARPTGARRSSPATPMA